MKTRILLAVFLSLALTLAVGWAISAQASGPDGPAAPPASTPQQAPVREVVVAIGGEPDTLYVYGASYFSTFHVLNALMDGPITRRNFDYQPTILAQIPRVENGDAVLRPVTVVSGTLIVDENDNVVTYTGSITTMPQIVVTFTLRSDVHWSDGMPLTTQDAAFGFQVACDPDTPQSQGRHYTCERTAAYDTPDALTTVWTGLPNFQPSTYMTNFWTPLPYHVLSTTAPIDILNGPYGHSPLGWGPFRLVEWVAGDHITVERNPYYWQPGYPRLDRVIFRWFDDPAALRQAVLQGQVQVATQDTAWLLGRQEILDLQAQGVLQVPRVTSTWWEHVGFDLLPADSRPVLFADPQVRQAVAYALDRQRIVDEVLTGFGDVVDSIVPETHPAYTTTIPTYPYSPTLAADLLTAAGWVDTNGNGIRDQGGQEFVFTHTTTIRPIRQQIGAIIQDNLAAVGISATLQFLSSGEFFAVGPDAPVFGRRFDTAEFQWGGESDPYCGLFLSGEIPGDWNGWWGNNYVGYSNPAYDQVCLQATHTVTRTEALSYYQQALVTLAEDLPVLPLYLEDIYCLADLALDPPPGIDASELSELWNIWAWDITTHAPVTPTEPGELIGGGGNAIATFPAGTFAEPVVVTYTPQLPVEPAGALNGIGLFYTLEGTSLASGLPVQPDNPYTMTFSYADAEAQAAHVDESTLALYAWEDDAWVREPSSVVDPDANIVTAAPDHFSLWAVLGTTRQVFLPVVMRNG